MRRTYIDAHPCRWPSCAVDTIANDFTSARVLNRVRHKKVKDLWHFSQNLTGATVTLMEALKFSPLQRTDIICVPGLTAAVTKLKQRWLPTSSVASQCLAVQAVNACCSSCRGSVTNKHKHFYSFVSWNLLGIIYKLWKGSCYTLFTVHMQSARLDAAMSPRTTASIDLRGPPWKEDAI